MSQQKTNGKQKNAKAVIKPPHKRQVPKVKHSGLNPTQKQYAKQLLTPIVCDASGLLVSPSSYPSQVCVRHLHRTVDIDTNTPAFVNGFTVVMSPDILQPVYVSAAANGLLPSGGAGVCAMNARLLHHSGGSLSAEAKVTDRNQNDAVIAWKLIPDSVALNYLGFNVTPGPASPMTISITNTGPSPRLYRAFYKVAGPWVAMFANSIAPGETLFVAFTTLLNTSAFAVNVDDSAAGDSAKILYSFNSMQIITAATETLVPGFERFVIDNEVGTGRVISMSILATNTSPALSNGGNINVARVPASYSSFQNIAQRISVLPENRRYQGPASLGGYCTWMPSQYDEYEIDNIPEKVLAYQQSEYLLLNVSGWTPPAGSVSSFRLQFDWIVEFYTPNQIFEKVITPPMTDEFRTLFYMLLSSPAATCNPEHESTYKDLIKQGIHYAYSGAKWAAENKELILAALAILAEIAG